MLYLATTADTTAIKSLIDQWVAVGQALVGSIGALAFVFAFPWARRRHMARFGAGSTEGQIALLIARDH